MFGFVIYIWHFSSEYTRVNNVSVDAFFQLIITIYHILHGHDRMPNICIVHAYDRKVLDKLIIAVFVVEVLKRVYVFVSDYVVM